MKMFGKMQPCGGCLAFDTPAAGPHIAFGAGGTGGAGAMSKPSVHWGQAVAPLQAGGEGAAGPGDAPAAGLEAAFDAFVRAHQAELLAFFQRRVQSRQDAADLAQESWARLMRYRGDASAGSLRLLLFGIARNLLSDHWRSGRLHAIEQPTDFAGFDVPCETAGPARQLDAQQSLARLEEAVANLPPKCRAVFLMSRVEGLRNVDIARRCGISVKMVEKHLARAILKCRAGVEGAP